MKTLNASNGDAPLRDRKRGNLSSMPADALQPRIRRYALILFVSTLRLGSLGCKKKDASIERGVPDPEMSMTEPEAEEELTETEPAASKGPCALTDEEVSGVIHESITQTSAQGNWGIASTRTYTTASSPVAVEVSSAMSADLSTDRMYEGAREVPGLGDEAVWVPGTSRLTVVDKSKNKLLRIGVDLPLSKDERLEVARAIAGLALAKL
ncbi:hypothetical protein [Rhodocaloribacter sp.]